MSNLENHPKVKTLAQLLEESHTTSEDNRIEFPNTDKLYEEHIGPLDELKKHQAGLLEFAAAQTLATGNIGQRKMVEDKTIGRISSRSQVGHSRIDTTYDREVTGTAAGKPWRKLGRAATDVTVGTGATTRAYRDVVAHLAEQGESVFNQG